MLEATILTISEGGGRIIMKKFNSAEVFVKHPDGNNSKYAQQLRRHLGNMLEMAEDLFGRRDRWYRCVGIEFHDANPQLKYLSRPDGDGLNIIIRLSQSAAQNMSQTCFEMAHETVHLLAPTGSQNVTNLHEGVACFFSMYYMKTILNEPKWCYTKERHRRVLELVTPRLKEDRYCIKGLRGRQRWFQRMRKEDIHEVIPKLTEEDVSFLISEFVRTVERCDE